MMLFPRCAAGPLLLLPLLTHLLPLPFIHLMHFNLNAPLLQLNLPPTIFLRLIYPSTNLL